MPQRLPTSLLKLWELAGGDPLDPACDWNSAFDPIGLTLFAPPRNNRYWCTPTNSLTFATTGGDGVHYGFVAVNGEFTDFSPIVMTVPMCDTPNVVVGANFREFLALGCRFGYFALEQLIYHRDETLSELALGRFDPEASESARALLQKVSDAFALSPWQTPGQRLAELEAHAAQLQLPPREEHAA